MRPPFKTKRRCDSSRPTRANHRPARTNWSIFWKAWGAFVLLVGLVTGDAASIFYVAGLPGWAGLAFVAALLCCVLGLGCWEQGAR